MKCPKCGNEQNDAVQCAACGVIFEKYRRYLEERAKMQSRPSISEPKGSSALYSVIGAAVVLLIGAAIYFMRPDVQPVPPSAPVAIVAKPATEPREQPVAVFSGLDIAAQLTQNSPPANPIEMARNATVLIQTPWGLGAGFFVDSECTVVTNRHVVKLKDSDIASVESTINGLRQQADEFRRVIDWNRNTYEKVKSGKVKLSGRKMTVAEMEAKLKDSENNLQDLENKIEEAERELDSNKFSNAVILVLADGAKIDGRVDYVSDERDLALVSVYNNAHCPSVPVGNASALHQGEKLFTIGSPMGLRHTVTSGIYSGNITIDGKPMLQTDAPINPGNSGGPLIDENGQVVGINTLVLNNSQGIGFAIPIDDAIKVLGLEL